MTMFLWNMFTMLVIAIPFANLLCFSLTFFLILPIHFGHIYLKAFFTKSCPAFCLRISVIFSSAPRHSELTTFFLETNAFAWFIFLPTFCSVDSEALFVKSPVCFGDIQSFFGIFTLEIWCRISIRARITMGYHSTWQGEQNYSLKNCLSRVCTLHVFRTCYVVSPIKTFLKCLKARSHYITVHKDWRDRGGKHI